MKFLAIFAFFFLISPSILKAYESDSNEIKYMKKHPASFIKIHDYNVYATWSSVAILHNVTIENTSDITYENIKVRIFYSSLNRPGNVISQEAGIIPVTVPPHSKNTYLRGGIPFGGGSQAMNAVDIQVLGAEVAN